MGRVGDDAVAVLGVRGEHAVGSGEMGAGAWIGHFALPIAALCFVIASQAIAIATLTVGINLIVDDISAHAGGKLSGRI